MEFIRPSDPKQFIENLKTNRQQAIADFKQLSYEQKQDLLKNLDLVLSKERHRSRSPGGVNDLFPEFQASITLSDVVRFEFEISEENLNKKNPGDEGYHILLIDGKTDLTRDSLGEEVFNQFSDMLHFLFDDPEKFRNFRRFKRS